MKHFCQNADMRETFVKANTNQNGSLLLRKITFSLLSCLFGNMGFSQVISWDFDRENGTDLPSVITANVSVSALNVGNNNGSTLLITNVSSSSGYTGASGNYNAGAAVPVQSFDPTTSTYFEFTLTPSQGYSFTVDGMSFGLRSTSTGPQSYCIRSSIDSYNSDIAKGSFNADGKWRLFTHSNLSLSNTSAITMRIYGFDNTGSASKNVANWRMDDLTLNVSAVPVIQSFRSRQDGNWKNVSTWESSADEIKWNAALTFPGKDDGIILIQQGHTVIVNSDVYLDQNVIAGTLEVQSGGILNISDGNGDDIRIAATGNLKISSNSDYATTIQQAPQANINILADGKITIGNGSATGTGYEGFATSANNNWNNGAVFEYRSSSTFAIAGLTFFPNASPAEIPIFRVSKVGGSVAAALNKDFLLNGILEINTDVTFTGAGKKNFRNGIRGTAVLSQLNAGKFYLTGDNAILDGSSLKIVLSQTMDLAPSTLIPVGANVTISGSSISNTSRNLTINGLLDVTTVTITNTSGFINLFGTYRTAHTGGFSGPSSSIPTDKNIFVNNGSTIELYANADQALTSRKDFANLIFSGSGKKTPGGPFNPAGTVTIKENAIFDCSGKNIGDESNGMSTSTNLTMSGNSRLIIDTYGPNPKMGGTYNLTGGTIEFKGSGLTPQTIRSKNYQNIEVTGSNVLMSEGNIYLNDKGTFTVKTGGVFSINDNTITGNGNGSQKVTVENGGTLKCGNNMGFNGAVITQIPIKSSAINADITNIILQKSSTVEYMRNGDQPITNANALIYQNLVLSGSGAKTAPPGNLFIQGNFVKKGTAAFDHNNGTVVFNGNAAQTFSSSSPSIIFYNLAIQNTLGLEINSGLSVYRKLSLEDNSKTFLNDDITFLSNKNQTAFISPLSTNVNIVYNSGRFVVERYINTSMVNGGHRKSWQFLSTPAFGETIFNTWQEKGSTTISGYGTWITGIGADNGFDAASAAPSMKYYNEEANNWTGIVGTNINMENPKGYMVFVRGDRKSNLLNSPATPTVLRIRGKLYTPTFPPPLNVVLPKNFQSVGNPYASAVDFSKLNTSNIGSYYIAWDPTLGGVYGFGGYQTISAATNYKAVPGNTSIYNNTSGYRNIQSGQAFLVYNLSESNGFVSFSEDCKLEDNHHLVNRTSGKERQILFTNLIAENGRLADGNAVVFDKSFSDKIDNDDALKMKNAEENFAIIRQDKILAVEARSEIKTADTIFYSMNNLRKQNYSLSFVCENTTASRNVFLVDKYLNTETKINLTDTSSFNFLVDSDEASAKPDRFYLLFGALENEKVFSVLSVNAIEDGKNVRLQWETENENAIIHYQIEHSTDGINFAFIGTVISENTGKNKYNFCHSEAVNGKNYYRIKVMKTDGSIQHTEIINIIIPDPSTGIGIFPNPVKGNYINVRFLNQLAGKYVLILYNSVGQKIFVKEINVSGKNIVEKLFIQKRAVPGVSQLEVIKPGGSRIQLSVVQ